MSHLPNPYSQYSHPNPNPNPNNPNPNPTPTPHHIPLAPGSRGAHGGAGPTGAYGGTSAGFGAGGFDGFSQALGSDPAMRSFLNERMLNAGVDMTRSWAGQYVPAVSALWASLKTYFVVNNKYVFEKLQIVLFPFRKKGWARRAAEDADMDTSVSMHKFALPKYDTNAPDLYIPMMAFVTFVLISGYAKGASNTFTPEVLTNSTTACLAIQTLELLVVRLLLYLMQVTVPLLDLWAFSGYKYVALCVNVGISILMGNSFYVLSLLYTATAMALFTLRTMSAAVPVSNAQGPPRHIVIGGIAASQYVFLWLLGRQ